MQKSEMDLNFQQPKIVCEQDEVEIKTLKRKNNCEERPESNKKVKECKTTEAHLDIKNEEPEANSKRNNQVLLQKVKTNREVRTPETLTKAPSSPKKRLEVSKSSLSLKPNKEKFIYGNYSQYYGYRNKGKDCHDIRLDVFAEHRGIFVDKKILDIGCNSGFITMEVAKQFEVKSIVGLDIDKSLINQAIKNLTKIKKSLPIENELRKLHKFPFNITFVHGNYVLKDDVLLEIERAQFDVILCLSITKWIHLNFGDKGLKQAFRRMFLQLNPQGKLILEAQPFDNYGRRKKMTDIIYKNFKDIKFLPKEFTEYMLSSEVGFVKVELMGVPDHCAKGFKRPIQIFLKS